MPAFFFLIIAFAACLARAFHNITVDDSDTSQITYSAGWTVSNATNSLDYGGFHHLSDQTTATASFTFTGVAIYFMAPLWPYSVAAEVTVDSFSSVLVDLEDYSHTTVGGPETVASAPVWGMTGLTNEQHTLFVSFAPGKQYLVLDALIYTVEDASDLSSSQSTSATSTSSDQSQTSSSVSSTSSNSSTATAGISKKTSHVLPIALGAGLGGAAVILIIIAAILLLRQRRKYPKSFAGHSYSSSTQPASFLGPSLTGNGAAGGFAAGGYAAGGASGQMSYEQSLASLTRNPSTYVVEHYSGTGSAMYPGQPNLYPNWSPQPHRQGSMSTLPRGAGNFAAPGVTGSSTPPISNEGNRTNADSSGGPVRMSYHDGAANQYATVLEYRPTEVNQPRVRTISQPMSSNSGSSQNIAGVGVAPDTHAGPSNPYRNEPSWANEQERPSNPYRNESWRNEKERPPTYRPN